MSPAKGIKQAGLQKEEADCRQNRSDICHLSIANPEAGQFCYSGPGRGQPGIVVMQGRKGCAMARHQWHRFETIKRLVSKGLVGGETIW